MQKRVLVTGAAGLVGQNLIARLEANPDFDLVAIDKHPQNTAILRSLHPTLTVIEADLAEAGPSEQAVQAADAIIMLQAQIGGLDWADFDRNNIIATRRVLAAAGGRPRYLIHVSSSVVNSAAHDFYTESKKAQEALVADHPIKKVILRPTLMFGWFDRKHLGWLRRFLDRAPVFPIPGDGRFSRQPLFAGDFAQIIVSCLEQELEGAFNISGLERIDYIDLIRQIRAVVQARTPIVRIPYQAFRLLLWLYALVSKNPPFTTAQLKALVTPDVFEVIDWPKIFAVRPTPLRTALEQTFLDPRYKDVTLSF